MRLIEVSTLQLKEFTPDVTPPYAILSHVWREDEITFAQFPTEVDRWRLSLSGEPETHGSRHDAPAWQEKQGLSKIRKCCAMAGQLGYGYVWIDTCCIDKSSSAELSEAINSMWAWYRAAGVCLAYLFDVSIPEHLSGRALSSVAAFVLRGSEALPFWQSRWLTRGWTLQELIAPAAINFYAADWGFIGTKEQMEGFLAQATGIETEILADASKISGASVARRMSWASDRQTTRVEDIAYCLMGIFDVNMPLIYGEGEKAFLRLQEAIANRWEDQSLFAWADPNAIAWSKSGLLAPHPRCFRLCGDLLPMNKLDDAQPHTATTKFVSLTLQLEQKDGHLWTGYLQCHRDQHGANLACITLWSDKAGKSATRFTRVETYELQMGQPTGKARQIYVMQGQFDRGHVEEIESIHDAFAGFPSDATQGIYGPQRSGLGFPGVMDM